MTKRVLGHGASCCGECELCTPCCPEETPTVDVFDVDVDDEDDE